MKKICYYLLIVLCLFMTGCGKDKNKNVSTLEQFESKLVSMGYTVTDNMKSYSEVSYILESKIGKYKDIQIEMIKYVDSETAIKVQDSQIESFNLLKSTGAHVEKEKGNNYYRYSLISNGRYMISTRIDNTLIFSKVMLKDKDTLVNIINSLGY